MIEVLIDGVDRTSLIQTLNVVDQLNQATDTSDFVVQQYGAQTYRPNLGEEVQISFAGDVVYGGVIVQLEQELDGASVISWSVKCKDYTQWLDREMVTERYTDETLRFIVMDLVDRYGSTYGFTGDVNVTGGSLMIGSVSFSEIPLSECFTKLAKLTGYFWYVDYAKDVHFFKKNEEAAPFGLTDTAGNHVYESLVVSEDLSQIRNSIKVRGGEVRGAVRTESYAGNTEQDTFPLGNKFAELPTVEVAGVAQTVGVDYLNRDIDFDVMWNFNEKYIRFTAGNIPPFPTGGNDTNIDITGIPLSPIVVQRSNNASITEFGLYEITVYNDDLKSRDEALQYAGAELTAYANEIREGSFDTYVPGLRSGQTISVASTARDIAETFLIQSVRFTLLTPDLGKWSVELASLKTIDLIDILQGLLQQERLVIGEDETLLNFFSFTDGFSLFDTDSASIDVVVTTTENYLWEQQTPGSDTYTNPIIWNKFTWL